MKNRFRSKAPPIREAETMQRQWSVRGGAWGANGFRLVLFLVLVGIPVSTVMSQTDAPRFQSPVSSNTSDPRLIREWVNIAHIEHPGFSRWCCALGDIDDDGYDDFAMASGYDTTFIFRGGDTLNPEPVSFVLGGSSGVVSADFNGDGHRDLATAVSWRSRTEDPDLRGRIRIYFRKSTAPFLGPEPDLELRGDSAETWGTETHFEYGSSLWALDFNGDGIEDLLAFKWNGKLYARFTPMIFLGGSSFDAIPDVILDHPELVSHDRFAKGLLLGDLNGDNCDDVMIAGSFIKQNISSVLYWDLFLGNPEGGTQASARMLRSDIGWIPNTTWAGIFDVNGDGIDDIVDCTWTQEYGDALVSLGSTTLPEVFIPNDSIPNPRPEMYGIRGPSLISPVGDLNGDGTRDLLIDWNTYYVPDGDLFYLFPMKSSGLVRSPTGYIGIIPRIENVRHGAHDVGDVNGDGYDDFAVLGLGRSEPPAIGWGQDRRFKIFLGAGNLQTAIPSIPVATSSAITIFPNPSPSAGGGIMLRFQGFSPGSARIELRDVLGRLLLETPTDLYAAQGDYQLPAAALAPGVYFIALCQGKTRAWQSLRIN